MTVVTTIDVYAMPPEEYRAILDHMGVETRPAAGLFLHLTAKTDFGFRVVEIWDRKEGFGTTNGRPRIRPRAQEISWRKSCRSGAPGIRRTEANRINRRH
jgi:hypothetical protein